MLIEYKDTFTSSKREEAVALNNSIKWYSAVRVSYVKAIDIESVSCTAVIRSRTELTQLYDDIGEQNSTCCEKVVESVAKFARDESG